MEKYRGWKGNIYIRRNYGNIKLTEGCIEQEQLVNDSIWNIEIAALKKSQRLYNDFMIVVYFIL